MEKNKFKKIAALAAGALLCCSAVFGSRAARAQCPPCPKVDTTDAQHQPANPPWNGHSITIDTMFGSCDATICFECRVTSQGNYDYKTNQICIDSDCWAKYCATHGLTPNTTASDSVLLSRANYDLFGLLFDTTNGNPCGFSCPQCPGDGSLNWNEYSATCWDPYYVSGDPTKGTTGHYVLVPCASFGWCLNAYTICCQNGQPTRKFVRSVDVTYTCGDSDHDCELINCPPSQDYP